MAQHIDTAKEELTKVIVHPATAKLLDSVQDELDKCAKESADCKKVRIADLSEIQLGYH